MTPAARIAAAIEILDDIDTGTPAEKALTGWARRSRFAGSGDRAAVRDHVFGVLRRWRSVAALGGAETGRGRMIGALRADGADLAPLFTGEGHAPSALSPEEMDAGRAPVPGAEAGDLPDWLWPVFQDSLGDTAQDVAAGLQLRAPVTLRVNTARGTVDDVVARLAEDGIATTRNPVAETALNVTEGARRVRGSSVMAEGLVELQDAASQALVAALPGLGDTERMLDYCAGGGGKSLAYAARSATAITAHDADPGRMTDLPARAQRAGVQIDIRTDIDRDERFDLVLCDVPCSGSGAWRRAPEAKWHLTPERLTELTEIQAEILQLASGLVAPGGILAYATCSFLTAENDEQIDRFCRQSGWICTARQVWPVTEQSDGFFLALLTQGK